ncbi:MAG: nitrogen fixation protein FixH, partial [Burkholderiaceae bacterium]
MIASDNTTPEPWWKFGHVWLVIAGPAIVVVAGFFTLYLALRYPD